MHLVVPGSSSYRATMRLLPSVLSSLLIAAVFIPCTLAQVKPAPPPTFETLFVGTLVLGESHNVTNGTFGTRMHGVITCNSGIFFPEGVVPVIWAADNKLGYLRCQGVGHVETDSEHYRGLNSRFIVGNTVWSDGNPTWTIFGALPAASDDEGLFITDEEVSRNPLITSHRCFLESIPYLCMTFSLTNHAVRKRLTAYLPVEQIGPVNTGFQQALSINVHVGG
ncbi:hypothetical protein C8Q76DRAFT_840209 [Earliella scabrosa]|nr:hypothetical protein C8Q76DRAFT_840209 [Earliella scabrosa]